MNNALLAPWVLEIGIISYRSAAKVNKSEVPKPLPLLPLPSEIGGAMIIFGILSLIPGSGQKPATYAGWGLVVATLLNLWNPGGTVAKQLTSKQKTPQAQKPAGTKG